MKQRRVTGAGLSLAVSEWGDPAAPTVVLVHGFPDSSAMWHPVAERLSHRYHVVAYDVRGAGASDVPMLKEGYRFPLLVDDLRAVVDAVSPGRAVHLVAHDWGSIQSWEAATSERLDGRLASFTSISGPPLDHAGHWMREKARAFEFGALASQGVRSAYIPAFHLPGAPWLASKLAGSERGRRQFGRTLRDLEGCIVDDNWPAPTFGADVKNGMSLYRANIVNRLSRPGEPSKPGDRRTDVPVQLIVPLKDRWVPPKLLSGLEAWSPTVWRREVQAGHWVTRSHPEAVARWVSELVDHIEGAPEPAGLRRNRVGRELVDDGRIVVITGAGSGIGRATALAFAERGATIVAADVNGETAQRTVQLCALVGGRDHVAHQVDVGDAAAVEAFAKVVDSDIGVPDIVINNAGIAIAGPFLKTSIDDWDQILRVNLWGVIHGSLFFGQRLAERAEGGHIVNVASAAAFQPGSMYPAYATTKAAVLMLSECLRGELAGSGVNVSAVCPGFANTGIAAATRYAGADADEADRLRRTAVRAYQRRNLSADTVAAAIVAAVDERAPVKLVGTEAHAARAMSRFAPGVARRIARVDLSALRRRTGG